MNNIQLELEQIKRFIKEQNLLQKNLLTLGEIALYLGQSKSSIYKLTSKREIPFYSPGGKKLYFKRAEIDNWVYESKVTPIDGIENEAEIYLSRNNKV